MKLELNTLETDTRTRGYTSTMYVKVSRNFWYVCILTSLYAYTTTTHKVSIPYITLTYLHEERIDKEPDSIDAQTG